MYIFFLFLWLWMCLSKWQAFKLATLSGFAEPLGVIIVGMSSALCCFVQHPYFLNVSGGICANFIILPIESPFLYSSLGFYASTLMVHHFYDTQGLLDM